MGGSDHYCTVCGLGMDRVSYGDMPVPEWTRRLVIYPFNKDAKDWKRCFGKKTHVMGYEYNGYQGAEPISGKGCLVETGYEGFSTDAEAMVSAVHEQCWKVAKLTAAKARKVLPASDFSLPREMREYFQEQWMVVESVEPRYRLEDPTKSQRSLGWIQKRWPALFPKKKVTKKKVTKKKTVRKVSGVLSWQKVLKMPGMTMKEKSAYWKKNKPS